MEKIKLTFLGTGSSVPTKRRNHPAILLQYKDENILIDCGEGTQRQFRLSENNPCKITRIFISHWHGDHVFGLPGILQTLALNGYAKTLKIYGPRGTKRFMDLYERLFIKRNQFPLEIHEISSGKFLDTKDFFIEAKEVFHDTPTLAYNFVIKEKSRLDKQKLKSLHLPRSPLVAELVKGKKVSINNKIIDGKKLVYREPQRKVSMIIDTSAHPSLASFAKDADLLLCEATYSKEEAEIAKEYSHMTSEDAANIAKKARAKKLVLFHLSQRYDKHPEKILQEAKAIFKETRIAEDLDSFEL